MKIAKIKFASLIVLALVVSMTAVTAVASACDDKENRQNGEMKAQFEEVHTAVTDGDYETWAILMAEKDSPRAEAMLEVINADNFYLLGEMMEARENHDREAAREITEELGLEFRGHRGGPHGGKR
ncbi:hypothetical protein HOM98_06090 [Candidatus Peregrinibacteria bacterium]|jgi:hypothetical protein|nr:hypothetical protein [Candidatus Peregrinibacteria bacterium]MBT7484633.1 hypothetical protein [Candidatus Peregrinibacteria bacterium]